MSYSEEWNWLDQFEGSLTYNPYVQEIIELSKKGDIALRANNFNRAGQYYDECSQIAVKANLLELELIYSHLANGMYFRLSRSDAIDRAVETVVKAQSLNVDNFPWYPHFQLQLAKAYQFEDPLSYVDEILEGYSIVEELLSYNRLLMSDILLYRSDLALKLQDLESAQKYVSIALTYTIGNSYYLPFVYRMQGNIYLKESYFLKALEAYKIEELHSAKTNKLNLYVLNSIHEQGVCLVYLNRMDEANERFAHCNSLEVVYQLQIYEWGQYAKQIALRKYDDVLKALSAELSKQNLRPYTKLRHVLGKSVVLSLMGQSNTQELNLAREVAQSFKKPEAYDLWVDAVANGDTFFHDWHKVDHSQNT